MGEYHDPCWSRSWNNKLKMIMHGNNFPTSTEKKESRRNEMAPETLMKRTVACQT